MKIQCQSCQAKYTIADEKVVGKVVKIRCKKCSSTIVINGNEMRAEMRPEMRPSDEQSDTHAFDFASQHNQQWTVNVADGDQRTMTAQEIVAEYRAGTLNDETYCWKEDMPDWLPLHEIESLYSAIRLPSQVSFQEDPQAAAAVPAPPLVEAPQAPLFGQNEPSQPSPSPFAGHADESSEKSAGPFASEAPSAAPMPATPALPAIAIQEAAAAPATTAPAPAAAAPAAAARRGGGRGQGADLFGNAARAGSDDDILTGMPRSSGGSSVAPATEEKLTGQRNESSVLFSLSALTEAAKNEAAPTNRNSTATADGSGLIDIRALSASISSNEKKDTKARIDDIMNLSGGGAFGTALAAPILAPSPLETADSTAAAGSKNSKALLWGLLGMGALIAAAIIIAVILLLKPSTPSHADANPPTAAVPPPTETTPTTAPTEDNTPPPPGTGQANPVPTPNATQAPPTTGGRQRGGPAPRGAVPGRTPESPRPPNATQPGLDDAIRNAVRPQNDAPRANAGGGATAPFDRGAASGALSSVNVQSCKKADGPTGTGHVKVTFTPDGSVSTAIVDSGPFQGTAVGGCVAGKYRGARVPAFSGGPVAVGKSFTIN
ncbi:MAG: zinc-ribbon domain-containing protein [Polyangiaceae bacterium]|nr:zinc-ribbon domain-containing protein [Polyangiaceae bacterium]